MVPRRRPMLLALAALLAAACNGDGPAGPEERAAGTYALTAVTVTEGGATQRRTPPAVVYEGPATVSGITFDVRVEVLRGSLTLERNRTYLLASDFRVTSRDGSFPPFEQTVRDEGRFTVSGGTVAFESFGGSELTLSGASLQDGRITVQVTDPIVRRTSLFEFTRQGG